MHCNDEYAQAKLRLREERRVAKHQRREEKRQAKQRRREEKREEKNRRREAKREEKEKYSEVKRYFRNEFRNYFMQPSTSNNNIIIEYPNDSNVHYNNNFHDERFEHDVAAIRTIFPDCDPEYIRNCLSNETVDHKRKVAEKLLNTDYPKVAPVSPATIPTAPPLPTRSSCDLPIEEAPPSYEESLGGSTFLQPPQLPKRHNRSSSWNGTSITQTQPTQPAQSIQQLQSNSQRSHSGCPTAEVADAISAAVKNFLASFKPASVQHACHKHSHVLMRPVPSRCDPQQFPEVRVLPKDKFSIQRGFSSSNYPTRKLRRNDVSEEDWYFFINGLNSIIGANSINGSPNNLGDGLSVSVKWVSWMKVTMDEKLMDSNIDAITEYLNKWNINFFNPRKIMVEFVDDRASKNESTGFIHHKEMEQYLLIKSI